MGGVRGLRLCSAFGLVSGVDLSGPSGMLSFALLVPCLAGPFRFFRASWLARRHSFRFMSAVEARWHAFSHSLGSLSGWFFDFSGHDGIPLHTLWAYRLGASSTLVPSHTLLAH